MTTTISNIPILRRTKLQSYYRFVLVMSMIIVGGGVFFNILQDFANQWYWLVIAMCYVITVEETFGHRMIAHNMFTINTKSITYKILMWFHSVNQSHGPGRYFATWHPAHHMYSDQGKADNVNFKEFWWGSASTIPVEFLCDYQIPNVEKVVEHGYRIRPEIFDDPWAQFCEKYSLFITTGTLILLFFIAPVIMLKVIVLGRFIIVVALVFTGICHLKDFPLSYRNFDTNDDSNNNIILHYIFLGFFSGLLQNNHHGKPNAINLGCNWWEIDTSTPVAHSLKYLMEKKDA
jgi:fatty-acid desaturase